MGRLDGKVALISGGARGMGAAHVERFVAEGARVVFGDIRDDEGQSVASSLGDDVRYVHHDVTREEDWAAAVSLALSEFGGLDILVNNAGILLFASLESMSVADFRRVLDVNATGCWLGMRAAAGPMREAGHGSIINISSIEGISGAARLSAYTASKFAVRGMTKSAATELGRYCIRVNSVHPGAILTPMVLEAASSYTADDMAHGEAFLKAMPLGRFAEPPEVSGMLVYLASDEASYCTGAEFLVDGGILAGPGY
jgi:3alpha(or 20beta)-hydroxysteroid dehydrogenase